MTQTPIYHRKLAIFEDTLNHITIMGIDCGITAIQYVLPVPTRTRELLIEKLLMSELKRLFRRLLNTHILERKEFVDIISRRQELIGKDNGRVLLNGNLGEGLEIA